MNRAQRSTVDGSSVGRNVTSPNPSDTIVTGSEIGSPARLIANTVSNGSAIGIVNPSL